MTSKITMNAGGSFWTVSVDGKVTDLGVKVTDHYRIYKRDGECGLPLADKLGHMIGRRIVQTPKHPDQTTEVAFRAAITAAI